MSHSPAGLDRAPVVSTDCSVCQSAGSVRRGVCDNCGARAALTDGAERERQTVPA